MKITLITVISLVVIGYISNLYTVNRINETISTHLASSVGPGVTADHTWYIPFVINSSIPWNGYRRITNSELYIFGYAIYNFGSGEFNILKI